MQRISLGASLPDRPNDAPAMTKLTLRWSGSTVGVVGRAGFLVGFTWVSATPLKTPPPAVPSTPGIPQNSSYTKQLFRARPFGVVLS
jgi:hypothetical protein